MFTDYLHRGNVNFKDEVGNEGFFDRENAFYFIESNFNKDFEEDLNHFKEKFSYNKTLNYYKEKFGYKDLIIYNKNGTS